MKIRFVQFASVVFTGLMLVILFGSIPCSGQKVVGPPPNDAEKTGKKIDAATAEQVLPYGLMSQDAYYDTATINIPGWTRVPGDWEGIFGNPKSGLQDQIQNAKSVGFYAAIYRNNRTGEISIAYRGTDSRADWWTTNIPAVMGYDPAQYHYAVALATEVETLYRPPAISVTGHSLGGGEATYTAQQTGGISKVVTFDSASPPILKQPIRNGTTQINIVVPRDTVGDNFIERGNLPGKWVYLDSSTAYQSNEFTKYQGPPQNRDNPIYNTLTGTHDMGGVIGGLCSITLSSSCVSLKPALAGQQPQPDATAFKPQQTLPAAVTPSTTFAPSASLSAMTGPGGISLSKAAAARMAINITLDGTYYKDGRLVLSGQPHMSSGFDAALFLTALRAACEPNDPYFSLDPVDVIAWDADGRNASEVLWRKISRDLNWGHKPAAKPSNAASSLTFRTIWARRDHPRLWDGISRMHPNFKARLVFRPEWLRQTRFGEILYKGDLLLKELSEGVPVLDAPNLRAGAIGGYVSASARHLARGLRSAFEHGLSEDAPPQWHSNRLWFDLVSSASDPMPGATSKAVSEEPPSEPQELAKLERIMQERGLIPQPISTTSFERTIAKDGDTLDVSRIYPKMFVRRTKEGKDISGSDPDLDGLSDDLNRNIEQYVAHYRELQILSELFRSYVVAVQIANQNDNLCDRLDALPLLDAERVSPPLPEFHSSELFISIGMYEFSVPNGRKLLSATARSASGGVSITGKSLSSMEMAVGGTLVTHNLNREVSKHPKEAVWGADGRSFIAFDVESDMPVVTDYIENEPPAAAFPKWGVAIDDEPAAATRPKSDIAIDNYKTWIAVLVLIMIALVARKRRRRT